MLLVFYQNSCFCNFSWKTVALILFHLFVLALNYRNVFSKPDDVTSPHLQLHDVKMLSILIENIVLEKSQESISITSVFITFIWVQGIKTSLWGSDDVIMMSQAPRPKVRIDTGSFLLSDTYWTMLSSQAFLRKKAERFEIASCLKHKSSYQAKNFDKLATWYILYK